MSKILLAFLLFFAASCRSSSTTETSEAMEQERVERSARLLSCRVDDGTTTIHVYPEVDWGYKTYPGMGKVTSTNGKEELFPLGDLQCYPPSKTGRRLLVRWNGMQPVHGNATLSDAIILREDLQTELGTSLVSVDALYLDGTMKTNYACRLGRYQGEFPMRLKSVGSLSSVMTVESFAELFADASHPALFDDGAVDAATGQVGQIFPGERSYGCMAAAITLFANSPYYPDRAQRLSFSQAIVPLLSRLSLRQQDELLNRLAERKEAQGLWRVVKAASAKVNPQDPVSASLVLIRAGLASSRHESRSEYVEEMGRPLVELGLRRYLTAEEGLKPALRQQFLEQVAELMQRLPYDEFQAFASRLPEDGVRLMDEISRVPAFARMQLAQSIAADIEIAMSGTVTQSELMLIQDKVTEFATSQANQFPISRTWFVQKVGTLLNSSYYEPLKNWLKGQLPKLNAASQQLVRDLLVQPSAT